MAEKPQQETQIPAKRPQEEVFQARDYRFHEEWSQHDRMMTALMIGSLKSAFPGYELPEGLEIKENQEKGRYHRRSSDETDGQVPLIEVKPERRFESLGHELGHDLHYQFIDDIHENKVVRSSFKEAFADLLMFYAVPVTPETRDLDRGLSGNEDEFETLRHILDPDKRRKELQHIRDTGLAVFQGDLEAVNVSARNMVETPPEYGRTLAVDRMRDHNARAEQYDFMLVEDEAHSRDNMFIANVEPGNVSFEDIAEIKTDLWRISEVTRHSETYPWMDPVEKSLEEDSRIGGKLQFTAENSTEYSSEDLDRRPYQVLETTFREELDLAYRMIDNYLDSLEETVDLPGEVLEGLEDVKYGKEYGENVDLPHSVGGAYAEELYTRGVTPYDLLLEKDKHVEALEDRLKCEIDQRI
jgi:hypothetical protein